MAKKLQLLVVRVFVRTNLCRQFAMKQQNFEIISLKIINQVLDKCKIATVHSGDLRHKYEYQRTSMDSVGIKLLKYEINFKGTA